MPRCMRQPRRSSSWAARAHEIHVRKRMYSQEFLCEMMPGRWLRSSFEPDLKKILPLISHCVSDSVTLVWVGTLKSTSGRSK